jgi:hypothetical protein
VKSSIIFSLIFGTLSLLNLASAKDQSAEQLLQSALNIKSSILNTPQEFKNSKIDLNFFFTDFNNYNQIIREMDNLKSAIFTLSSDVNQLSANSLDSYKKLVIWSATTKVSVSAFEARNFFGPVEKAPKILRTILINNCDIPVQIKTILRADIQRDILKIKNDFMQLRTGSAGGGRHGANRTLKTLKYGDAVNNASEINNLFRKISLASSSLTEAQRDVLSNLAMDISNDTYESGDFAAYNVFQVFRNDSSTEYINAISNDTCS